MNGIRQLLLATVIFAFGQGQLALADPFIDNDTGLNARANEFSKSLGEAGLQMRSDYDSANILQSQRSLAEQQSVQDGTQAAAQQSFMNGQMQASYGGASGYSNNYGNNGLFGASLGPGGIILGGFGNSANSGSTAALGADAKNQQNNSTTSGPFNYSDAYASGYATGYGHGSANRSYTPWESLSKKPVKNTTSTGSLKN